MRAALCLPLLFLIGVLIGCAPGVGSSGGDTNRVGVEEFARLMEEGDFTLLDVRTPKEFAAGHIPGAINLDVQSASFADELRALNTEETCLVYCRSGRRSQRAGEILAGQGFEEVIELAPGFNAWKSADKPTQR
jgi:rhodanese-related sulfurtransferase